MLRIVVQNGICPADRRKPSDHLVGHWQLPFFACRMRCIGSGHVDYNVNVAEERGAESSHPPKSGGGIAASAAHAAAQAKAFFTSTFESKVRSGLFIFLLFR